MDSVSNLIGFMETPLTILHIVVAFFMILVVLIQGGSAGGVGATLGGGGNSNAVFGATGATTILGKATYACAFMFMLTSISLCIAQSKQGSTGLDKKVQEYNQQQNGGLTTPDTTKEELNKLKNDSTTPDVKEAPKGSSMQPSTTTDPGAK